MRISDWSSDVCSSDLAGRRERVERQRRGASGVAAQPLAQRLQFGADLPGHIGGEARAARVIAFGRAVDRDRARLSGILGGVGQGIAPREIADARREQRRKPREGPVSAKNGRATSELQSLIRTSYAAF